MPAITTATDGNILAAQALYEQGASTTEVAKTLKISRASAWRLKHQALLEPGLIQHVSKTLADKALLSANAAIDAFLDQAETGALAKQAPVSLAKAASVLMQSAGAYAALSGAKDTLSSFVDEFGLTPSATSSRLTLTQQVTKQVVVEPK